MRDDLQRAEVLRRQGRIDEAMRLANQVLNEELDNPHALFLIAHCLIDAERYGLANSIMHRFLQLQPQVPAAYINLGRTFFEANRLDEAERCFQRALKINKDDAVATANLGLIALYRCDADRSIKLSEQSLRMNPQFRNARHNLGLACLMKQDWVKGWENYEASVGSDKDRKERIYGEEERWDGSPGKVVAVYGEQGIGDEISFASMVPDAAERCRELILETDARLAGLFCRSFPNVRVYGTRYEDVIDWADKHTIEARCSLGTLGKWFRTKAEDFPGTPYLVADPERRIQWRALLDSLGDKPKIGIAWTGGLKKTGHVRRSVTLQTMQPILAQDATFISLQYRDPSEEIAEFEHEYGVKVHHWPRAAEARDYDEVAALVAELDLVITVTTSVVHLAGGLGVPCWTLVPRDPMWRYGLTGEKMPWYDSVTMIRQKRLGHWHDEVAEAAYRLRDFTNGIRHVRELQDGCLQRA